MQHLHTHVTAIATEVWYGFPTVRSCGNSFSQKGQLPQTDMCSLQEDLFIQRQNTNIQIHLNGSLFYQYRQCSRWLCPAEPPLVRSLLATPKKERSKIWLPAVQYIRKRQFTSIVSPAKVIPFPKEGRKIDRR